MTKAEYDRKVLSLKGTHDYDMLCFIRGQYIESLEAALDKAAHQLYDYSGSCPSDLYYWEHPNTCIRECDRYDNPDEAWKCWRFWLLEKPKERE